MFQICPKCAHARDPEEDRRDVCPNCGLVFSKYVLTNAKKEKERQAASLARLQHVGDDAVRRRILLGVLLALIVAGAAYYYPM